MSLINKMLQDLDARGTGHGGVAQPHIKPVAQVERGVPPGLVAGVLAAALVLGGAGVAGWRYLHRAPMAAQPVTVVMTPAAVATAVLAPAAVTPPRPRAAVATVPSAAPVIPAAVAGAATTPAAAVLPAPAPALAQEQTDPPMAPPAKMSHKDKAADKVRRAAGYQEQSGALDAARAGARAAALAHGDRHEPDAPNVTTGAGKHDSTIEGREETAGQRAEGAYRSALASLQEGRVTEAMAALRQALQADAHHDAARQTLVGLLIEHGQPDEAMHQLQLGLTLDPRQPALAMLLARLQIERGGSGVETLMRTLPYAAGNGEYHAFLAGALQRQQRHHEAAEQYQAALRGAPQNGVWWMGLGISLQAEKRDAEAVEAFQKARASRTLSPELLAFVEGKLRQFR